MFGARTGRVGLLIFVLAVLSLAPCAAVASAGSGLRAERALAQGRAVGASTGSLSGLRVTVRWPGAVEERGTLAVKIQLSQTGAKDVVRLDRRVAGRWVHLAEARGRVGRLRWGVTVRPAPLTLRVSVWRGRRLVGASVSHVVLVYVGARVIPERATTVSAAGYSLTVPAGTVSGPTTATVTPLDSAAAGLPGPSVRFRINGRWRGSGRRVRVTLPLDPHLKALGSGYVPVLVHLLDGGGGQVLFGRSLKISDGELSYETPSLSIFTSFSLPKISLASLKEHAVADLAALFGNDLSGFLGQHTSTPSCSPNDTSRPDVSTTGSAFSDVEAIDYQPTLRDCVTISGTTAIWTVANNTGATLAVDVDSKAPSSGVKIGALTSSGDPLLDYVFGKENNQVNAGADGGTPELITLPAGAGVKVAVQAGSAASLSVDEDPLGTLVGFVLSEVGSVAGAPGDIYDALKQCDYSPARTGASVVGLLQCLYSSTGLIKAGPKALEAVGAVLLVVTAGITVKQSLGLGHRTGALTYMPQSPGTAGGSPGSGGGTGSSGGGTGGGATGGGAAGFDHATPLGPTSGPAGFGLLVGVPDCSGSLVFHLGGDTQEDTQSPGPITTVLIEDDLLPVGTSQVSFRCVDSSGNTVWQDPGFSLDITGPRIPASLQSRSVAAGTDLVYTSGASAGPSPCPTLSGHQASSFALQLNGPSGTGVSYYRTIAWPDGTASENLAVPASAPAGTYDAEQSCTYGGGGDYSGVFDFAPQSVTVS